MPRPRPNRRKDTRSIGEKLIDLGKSAVATAMVSLILMGGVWVGNKLMGSSSPEPVAHSFKVVSQEVGARASSKTKTHAPKHKATSEQEAGKQQRWVAECADLAKQEKHLRAYYEEEADRAMIIALQNGVLKTALATEIAMDALEGYDVRASAILTLNYLESSMGSKQGKANGTTGLGICQYTDGAFLGDFALFLAQRVDRPISEKASDAEKARLAAWRERENRKIKKFVHALTVVDASIVKEAAYLASFVRFDPRNSNVSLDEEGYKAAQKGFFGGKKGLRDTILKLREGDKGQGISMLLAFANLKRKLPYLEKKLSHGSLLGVTKKLFGDAFLLDMVHNWGFDGTVDLFDADPNSEAGSVVDAATLDRNGFKNPHVTVGFLIVKIAQKCFYLDRRFEVTAHHPDIAIKAQQERDAYRLKVAQEKAKKAQERKAAQEALTKPLKGKKQAMIERNQIKNGGGQKAYAALQNRPVTGRNADLSQKFGV